VREREREREKKRKNINEIIFYAFKLKSQKHELIRLQSVMC